MRTTWSLLAAMTVAACTSVPLASPELDAEAKRFEPPPAGSAALYVVRDGYRFSAPVTVLIDDRPVGTLNYDAYLRVELRPGLHDVRVRHDETRRQLAATQVTLGAGEIRYVSIANAAFDSPLARSVTELAARELPSAQGRAAVLSRDRAAPWR